MHEIPAGIWRIEYFALSLQNIRVLSSVGLERLLDRQEVSSSNLLDPTNTRG